LGYIKIVLRSEYSKNLLAKVINAPNDFRKEEDIDGSNYGIFLPGFSKFSGSNDFLR
jgi:hypothetical protein